MNNRFKPGDKAVIWRAPDSPEAVGVEVEILYRTPLRWHKLPCGQRHFCVNPNAWVVRFSRPVRVTFNDGTTEEMMYGSTGEDSLREVIE